MALRLLRQRPQPAVRTCCAVLLALLLLWYTATGAFVWAVVRRYQAGQPWQGLALLAAPAVLLALSPFAIFRLSRFIGRLAGRPPAPAPLPVPPTVPAAAPATLTEAGPRYRLPRREPSSLTGALALLVAALGFIGLAAPCSGLGACGDELGLGGWSRWLSIVGMLVLCVSLPPLALAALLALPRVLRRHRTAAQERGLGRTVIELSEHPLRPGGRCRGHLAQAGQVSLDALRVLLVCEEEANVPAADAKDHKTRKETRRVREAEVFRRERVRLSPDQPLFADFDLELPAGAMHSFDAVNNKVIWSLRVVAERTGRPPAERAFRFIVYPPLPVGG
jgi:hypothetical protein